MKKALIITLCGLVFALIAGSISFNSDKSSSKDKKLKHKPPQLWISSQFTSMCHASSGLTTVQNIFNCHASVAWHPVFKSPNWMQAQGWHDTWFIVMSLSITQVKDLCATKQNEITSDLFLRGHKRKIRIAYA